MSIAYSRPSAMHRLAGISDTRRWVSVEVPFGQMLHLGDDESCGPETAIPFSSASAAPYLFAGGCHYHCDRPLECARRAKRPEAEG